MSYLKKDFPICNLFVILNSILSFFDFGYNSNIRSLKVYKINAFNILKVPKKI